MAPPDDSEVTKCNSTFWKNDQRLIVHCRRGCFESPKCAFHIPGIEPVGLAPQSRCSARCHENNYMSKGLVMQRPVLHLQLLPPPERYCFAAMTSTSELQCCSPRSDSITFHGSYSHPRAALHLVPPLSV